MSHRADDGAATGAERAAIVGHGLGGLVPRAYMRFEGGAAKVAELVTLGSPHRSPAAGLRGDCGPDCSALLF
ncbi:triacylglycerol lipase [Planomonospora sp. ID82291]|uniref:esterase/lipase family protein n=1 Tax=Planomonospora sp. ID82291 TaxID=2738136 RepID=UPI0018C3EE80|nr:hypothetical protein [Planomonospora sp. ID82291]MBG0817317.1 hypothetical protein [Planomonospora sp. ID82291]